MNDDYGALHAAYTVALERLAAADVDHASARPGTDWARETLRRVGEAALDVRIAEESLQVALARLVVGFGE